MRNKYIFLRHGETIITKEKKNIYPKDQVNCSPITIEGKRQIEKAAKALKSKGIDFIYSSDFLRARQTSIILKKQLGLDVVFDKRLRDIDFGIFHGAESKEYENFFLEKKQRFFKRPPKGENWRDVKKRVVDFIKEIDRKYKNKKILIISHGDPIWILNGFLKGLNEKKILETRNLDHYLAPSAKEAYPETGKFLEDC